MGLPHRITYNEVDYVYEVLDSSDLNKESRELQVLLNKEKVSLVKDERDRWIQQNGESPLEPDFIQAIGRSISLRFRL